MKRLKPKSHEPYGAMKEAYEVVTPRSDDKITLSKREEQIPNN
jgi:hypothetical protein